eukprot:6188249-Pleurochrysis_carterae.AAC.1
MGGLSGSHGCHLLAQLAQLVAQGGHAFSNSDGLGVHGAALGVNGFLVLHAVILLEHGGDLEAHLVTVVAPLVLVDLARLVHANNVKQVRGKGVREGRGQQVVAPMVRADPSSSELSSRSVSAIVLAAASVPDAIPSLNQGLALIRSLGVARVVVLDLVQVLDVHPSPMRVVVV